MRSLLAHFALLVAVAPAVVAAQGSTSPVQLEWPGLRVSIAPDSAGTRLALGTYTTLSPDKPAAVAWRTVTVYADPISIRQWVPIAREFVARDLTETDTGAFRGSEVLPLNGDDQLGLARRRIDGKWSPDRVVVLQFRDRDPQLIPLTREVVQAIFDSLESVAVRTVATPTAAAAAAGRTTVSITAADTAQNPEVPPRPLPGNPRPRWPRSPRDSTVTSATVILDFIVKADGTVDMKSVKVVSSPDPAFLNETLGVLRTWRFAPGQLNGKPMDTRARQTFQFSRGSR
jgi:TonB family protein